jgi:hypothetical protein
MKLALWGALVTATAMSQDIMIGQMDLFALHKVVEEREVFPVRVDLRAPGDSISVSQFVRQIGATKLEDCVPNGTGGR